MATFILWYIVITILGWLSFPLAYHLFPALSDRGYTLSRAAGMLVWGYVFWLFASLGIAQNDAGGLLLALIVLIGLSAWIIVNHKSEIVNWLSNNRRLIITTELLFLLAFAFMAFIRANNPETFTAGGEKWMEVAFINAILHSPTFPPNDPWLSGYAISYYYFGYVMTAMLAKLTSTTAPVAHNLMLSLIFALSAIGAYGLLYNLLAAHQKSKVEKPESGSLPVFGALFAPLFLLVISNLAGLLEVLHKRGRIFTWLDIPELNQASTPLPGGVWERLGYWWNLGELNEIPIPQSQTWLTQISYWLDLKNALLGKWFSEQFMPDRFFWWWKASRVLQDYDLNNARLEIIDEFPFFSYLLGDLHPHVLAMPFNLLAIAIALNLFFGGWRGTTNLFFGQLKINGTGFFSIALILGGLAFLNTWDILPAAALIVFSYALARVKESGWGWERLEDILLLGIPVGITAFVMYLPFFVGFDSQAGGIIPNFMYVTRGAHLWVMWGTLFIPLFAYLLYLWRSADSADWRTGLFSTFGLVLVLFAAMFIVGLLAMRVQPDLVNQVLAGQGRDAGTFIADSMKRRLQNIGSLITLLTLLIPTIAFLTGRKRSQESSFIFPSFLFVLLLIGLGTLLILGPEFFYLRDNFGYRINTIFKFYYQAWILLSLAAAFGVAVVLSEVRGVISIMYRVMIVVVIGMGLVYPAFSIPSKTDNFKTNNLQSDPEQTKQRTLDGSAYLARVMPEDYQAFQFMQGLEPGVVAEAVGGQYSEFARVATFTGMPTVLGWPGHEGQWRDSALQGSRQDDIAALYSTNDWLTARDIIERYDIRYVYIGNLERSTYRLNEEKFNLFLKPVYQQGNVTIYEVP